MKRKPFIIRNGSLILPDRVEKGHLLIEDGQIAKVDLKDELRGEMVKGHVRVLEGDGYYIMPGMIETHSDAIEKEVEPRPDAPFPLKVGLYEIDKKLAGHGITTMYHSVSLSDGTGARDDQFVQAIIEEVYRKQQEPTMVRHQLHLRFEVTNPAGVPIARQLLEEGKVQLLSFMDHTPGQGQFKSFESYQMYMKKNFTYSDETISKLTDDVLALKETIDWEAIRALAAFAQEKGIPLASHDDDSIEKIDELLTFGVRISEFPIHLEAAAYAREKGLYVSVGAPNIVRGKSHSNNMKAIDAVKAGYVDMLCSDYHPSALLIAAFKLVDEGLPLHEAISYVTSRPAQALNIDKRIGSIEEGKGADLLFVEKHHGFPFIRKTIVNGVEVYEGNFYSERLIGNGVEADD